MITSVEPDAEDLALLQNQLRQTGVVEQALTRAREHTTKALAAVNDVVSADSLASLEAVADFIFRRNT